MILDSFKLEDKVAIITGAGRGVGKGIALTFAEVGATVVCAARTQDEIDREVGMEYDSCGGAFSVWTKACQPPEEKGAGAGLAPGLAAGLAAAVASVSVYY